MNCSKSIYVSPPSDILRRSVKYISCIPHSCGMTGNRLLPFGGFHKEYCTGLLVLLSRTENEETDRRRAEQCPTAVFLLCPSCEIREMPFEDMLI